MADGALCLGAISEETTRMSANNKEKLWGKKHYIYVGSMYKIHM